MNGIGKLKIARSGALLLAALGFAAGSPALAQKGESPPVGVQADQTLTGIPLDMPWKVKLYEFATGKLRHPAWGWTHSERDYHLALEIAAGEKMKVDTDILFAAAFAHDIGAIGEYQKEDMDHAERSVEIADTLLVEFGFPAEKMPAVREAILAHMHDKVPGKGNEAIVLRDADTLDFLGTVGVARRLSTTGDATSYEFGTRRIREFSEKLPGRLTTRTAKAMAPVRAKQMQRFIEELDAQTTRGLLP